MSTDHSLTTNLITMLAQNRRFLKVKADDGWKWGFVVGYLENPARWFSSFEEAVGNEIATLFKESADVNQKSSRLEREAQDIDNLAQRLASLLDQEVPDV